MSPSVPKNKTSDTVIKESLTESKTALNSYGMMAASLMLSLKLTQNVLNTYLAGK